MDADDHQNGNQTSPRRAADATREEAGIDKAMGKTDVPATQTSQRSVSLLGWGGAFVTGLLLWVWLFKLLG